MYSAENNSVICPIYGSSVIYMFLVVYIAVLSLGHNFVTDLSRKEVSFCSCLRCQTKVFETNSGTPCNPLLYLIMCL